MSSLVTISRSNLLYLRPCLKNKTGREKEKSPLKEGGKRKVPGLLRFYILKPSPASAGEAGRERWHPVLLKHHRAPTRLTH